MDKNRKTTSPSLEQGEKTLRKVAEMTRAPTDSTERVQIQVEADGNAEIWSFTLEKSFLSGLDRYAKEHEYADPGMGEGDKAKILRRRLWAFGNVLAKFL